jgi:pre-mRNA-splicing factor SPF27
MDFIREYDFDSLPYIDQDYDDPQVKANVDALVRQEMASFAPADYLAKLLYPQLPVLEAAMEAQQQASSSSSRRSAVSDFERNVAAPEGGMASNAQAWRGSVSAAKSELVQQQNRLMNLEAAEQG